MTRRGPTSVNRRGVALVAALSLLALLGLIVVAAVASSSLSQRAATASLDDASLLGAAEYAAVEPLTDPRGFGLADLPLQQPRELDVVVPGTTAKATVTVTRLPFGAYWLVGDATTGGDSGRRRIGLMARTAWIGPSPAAPFVARGATTTTLDVIVLPDDVGEPDCVVHTVPDAVQTADSTALFDAPGQWSALASAPGVRLTSGDTTLTGGSLDGILMVAGNLLIDGPFDATGLIVARGRIRSTAGFHLTGALVSQSGAAVSIDLHGATVRYSPCVVDRLLRRASPVETVPFWRWAELF